MRLLPKARRSRLRAGQHLFVGSMLTPIMIYIMAFALLPMVWAVTISFFRYSPVRQGGFLGLGGSNPFLGLRHFREMGADTPAGRVFRTTVKNTLIFALAVLPFNLAITLPLAILIESVMQRLKTLFRTIYFLPAVTSLVAVSIVWGHMYNPSRGLLNLILQYLGFPSQAWLTDPRKTVAGIALPMLSLIVMYIWQDMGYNLVIFIAGLQSIPEVFYEAALVDGVSAWQKFRHITLPLLRPTLIFIIVMTMLSSWQVFVIFQVMTGGRPGDLTRTMVLYIYDSAFRYQQMGWASAMSMVLFAIILVSTLIQLRVLRQEWEY